MNMAVLELEAPAPESRLAVLPPKLVVQAERARRSFQYFFEHFAWPVLQPATVYRDNWHIGVICDHVAAVKSGQIRKLLVNMPFRMLKSSIISQAFQAWDWIDNPSRQYLTASYAKDVATRDAVDTRRIIESPKYQACFGVRYKLTTDQNVKQRYENDKRGTRIITSTEAAGTGFGGDIRLVDDPVSAKEATSPLALKASIEWWKGTMATRANDPGDIRAIVVHQRMHVSDLTGYLLENEQGWEHLVLPFRFDSARVKTTSLGFMDPRKVDGELIHPARVPEEAARDLETTLGSYHANAQLQQNPAPREGGLIKGAWLANRWRLLPLRGGSTSEVIRVVQSWDTAKKVQEMHDYSVCTTWFETRSHYILADVLRERMEFPALKRAVLAQNAKWSPDAVLIEDAASGTSLIQQLREETSLPVIPITPTMQKELRLEATAPLFESGRVILPEAAPWLSDYETELTTIPMAEHDDQGDSTSQFLNWARKPQDVFIG